MTGSVKPSPPQTPNGGALAAGQTYGDVQTAIGNTIMQNANEQNPYGQVNYTKTGAQTIQIPIFNNQGAFQGMQSIDVPQFNKSTTLTPTGQQMLDQQQQIGTGLNNLALSQEQRLSGTLGSPVSADGLPARVNSYGAAPNMARSSNQFDPSGPVLKTLGPSGAIQTSIGPTNYEGARSSVENAILSRVNPQLDRDRNTLETKLVNQGLVRGTDAFNTAMDESNRQANDARMQAVLAGGQEQSRLAGLDLSKGQFANTTQQQGYDQGLQATQFWNQGQNQEFNQGQQRGMFDLQANQQNNTAAQQEYSNAQSNAQFQNENRNQAMQEMLGLRNQPINEITALLNGGQVNVPQFQNYSSGTIAQSPISQNAYNSAAIANQNYQTQQSGTNALLGALGGLGGAGLYGLGKKYG